MSNNRHYTYFFVPYDILQIKRGETWLDFSTLRTEGEAQRALELVALGQWEGNAQAFRVCRMNGDVVAE